MPIRSITKVSNVETVISLDYDGIRIVYPNTTFGPSFGILKK